MNRYIILFSLIFTNVFSQHIQVEYFENRIIKNPNDIKKLPKSIQKTFEPNRMSYTLTYINGTSIYVNNSFTNFFNTEKTSETETLENGDKIIYTDTYETLSRLYKPFEKKFYKDYLNKKIYAELYTDETKQIVDDFFNWQWEITNYKKEINGYLCTKAISKINGYHFEAWFTEEIPISAGPEKFDSLPGLILYVNTGAVEMIAKSIKFNNIETTIQKPVFAEKTYSFNEVYTNKNEKKYQFKTEVAKDSNNNIIKKTFTY